MLPKSSFLLLAEITEVTLYFQLLQIIYLKGLAKHSTTLNS